MRPVDSIFPKPTSIAKIATFLVLTFAIAAAPYAMMARTGSTRDYVLAWMWSPGIAALATQLIFDRSIRHLGWKVPSPGCILLGFAIPLGYSLLIYATVWTAKLGTFHGQPPSRLLFFGTFGLLAACFAALGEEIGWRGLLVPELARVVSFSRVSAITGVVWALWHYPAVLFADYHSEAPRWLDILSLTVAVIGLSFFTARLRLLSGSIWPCVVWHGTHNLLIQQILYDLTIPSARTHYFIDDFGIGVLVASLVLGLTAWAAQARSQEPPVVAMPRAAEQPAGADADREGFEVSGAGREDRVCD